MSALFLKLIYNWAGTVVHLLLLKFSMGRAVMGWQSYSLVSEEVELSMQVTLDKIEFSR